MMKFVGDPRAKVAGIIKNIIVSGDLYAYFNLDPLENSITTNIDWKQGVQHKMDNHKQFAYAGDINNSQLIMFGFYSKHH
ncbi:MAG: hypothetical protein K2X37_12525 [Chitinophagaceae bacterium]|nr:hypothetical protein [Chitinophagaceae bacterium]